MYLFMATTDKEPSKVNKYSDICDCMEIFIYGGITATLCLFSEFYGENIEKLWITQQQFKFFFLLYFCCILKENIEKLWITQTTVYVFFWILFTASLPFLTRNLMWFSVGSFFSKCHEFQYAKMCLQIILFLWKCI